MAKMPQHAHLVMEESGFDGIDRREEDYLKLRMVLELRGP